MRTCPPVSPTMTCWCWLSQHILFTQSSLFTAARMVHSSVGLVPIFHTRMPPSPVHHAKCALVHVGAAYTKLCLCITCTVCLLHTSATSTKRRIAIIDDNRQYVFEHKLGAYNEEPLPSRQTAAPLSLSYKCPLPFYYCTLCIASVSVNLTAS